MLTEMKALAKQNDICVLATVAGQKPHCSLMAYVTDDNCEEIYMVTHKNSSKYQNLMQNPAVSLLIDTREKSHRSDAKALTVEGVFRRIENAVKQKQVASRLLQTHPHLATFMQHPEAEV
ncbi:MAG: pyridoxamine 5'-phosphate oxidase family protein, partial [Desulfobacterales bacterium]|nr:pyridoxamine 5'-phosphate oxidase family protein [Desulfobacterales bacterium]